MNTELSTTDVVTFKKPHLLTVNKITSYLVHDINNVLQTIIGSAEMLLMAKNTDALINARAKTIKTASLSAIKLMNYILDLNYKRGFDKRKLDINLCVENMQDILDKICGSRATIYYELYSGPLNVIATELYIEEILFNLTINSKDAISTEGIITISTAVVNYETAPTVSVFGTVNAGRYCYIKVKDTGCGIAKNIMSLIHKPTFTTKKNGNGIGLHIVFTIAKELSGFVTVESAEQKGTTITVYIPQAADVVAPPCSCA